jgi:hypothetical protein
VLQSNGDGLFHRRSAADGDVGFERPVRVQKREPDLQRDRIAAKASSRRTLSSSSTDSAERPFSMALVGRRWIPAGQIVFGDFDPQIRPGRRYFLAVRNEFPDTNAFCIRVKLRQCGLAPDYLAQRHEQLRSMSNVGQVVDYFSFDVSSKSVGVEFSITNIQGGDVNLYVKRGLPLPGTNFFTQASANADPLAGEFVQFSDLSQSQLAGRWYAAVVVSGGAPSYGHLRARIPCPGHAAHGERHQRRQHHQHRCRALLQGRHRLECLPRRLPDSGGASNIDLFVSSTTMSPLAAAPTNGAFAAVNGAGGR